MLPEFMHRDVDRHVKWFADKVPNGLLFFGEKGAPLAVVLRTEVAESPRESRPAGDDAMACAGQSPERAALIQRHSTLERQKGIAAALDARVRADRKSIDGHNDAPSGTRRAREG
ncbi:hypothetical protein ACIP98_01240 [Streptomyces sp. NPDC088354]|uniref:hypothetical protein n=1 Tax=Streptomyces sp. NPDC088354 TaxID=3365856 RepID=UPI00380E18C0